MLFVPAAKSFPAVAPNAAATPARPAGKRGEPAPAPRGPWARPAARR
jgi:hypothetical protein